MDTRFAYFRDENRFPVGCVAYTYSKENKRLYFAISSYNKLDAFDRKMGRKVAASRLLQSIEIDKDVPSDTTGYIGMNDGFFQIEECEKTGKIMELISRNVLSVEGASQAVRNAAREYLKFKKIVNES